MARLSRLVVPGHPHYVTQRGSRRLDVFSGGDDYRAYLALITAGCAAAGTAIWAYCLMPRHVHFVLVPTHADGLRAAVSDAHRRYARRVNLRQGSSGHLWRERFHSLPMDETYLQACVRYVEFIPVIAGLTRAPEGWPWSSTRAHLSGTDDGVVHAAPLLSRVTDWAAFLAGGVGEAELKRFHAHAGTGRPLGAEDWVETLERQTGRTLRPGRRGRPPK